MNTEENTEEKELLLKDLCARLPYGVKCKITTIKKEEIETLSPEQVGVFKRNNCKIYPYLRPMDSMTEKELREFAVLKFKNDDVWEIDEFPEMKFGFKGFINVKCRNRNNGDTWIYQVTTRTPLETYWGVDWLNANYFDYRNLIKKGLALKASAEMYKKNQL